MPTVRLTSHLHAFFPQLGDPNGPAIEVEGKTVAEVVARLETIAPGIGFYLCDELGRLRTHVNVFVDRQMIRDRRTLSDAVAKTDEVLILQALSGG